MTITGGIKFFDLNLADSKNGISINASSGNPSAPFILDRNKYTVWRSVGSNDTIQEDIGVVFQLQGAQTFNRLFLIGHNFDRFLVQYWNGAAYVDFSNVIGINGVAPTGTGIHEIGYTNNAAYYEFDAVTSLGIAISALKTQIPNEEKFLNSLVIGNELGTLAGLPIIKSADKNKNLRKSKLLNGRMFVTKSLETMKFSVDFKNYPTLEDYHQDLDLVYSLFDRDNNFLTWLCGGRTGDPYFKYNLRGFRIEDLIETQVTNIFKDSYKGNYYNGTAKLGMILEEAG